MRGPALRHLRAIPCLFCRARAGQKCAAGKGRLEMLYGVHADRANAWYAALTANCSVVFYVNQLEFIPPSMDKAWEREIDRDVVRAPGPLHYVPGTRPGQLHWIVTGPTTRPRREAP